MSFLSGSSAKLVDKPPKVLGVDSDRVASNEQARPVPYLAGRQRMPVTFISKAFNIRTKTKTKGGGLFGGETVVGTDYYASFAVAVCLGAVDRVHEIRFDDVVVWSGNLTRGTGTEDYVDITIEDRGTVRLYWGTETQDEDPHLNDTTLTFPSGQDHPPYRGTCYAVFNKLYFGRNRTNAPNIEFTLSRYPVPSWSGESAALGNDANPAHIFYDLLASTRAGLGIAYERFDPDELLDLADDMDDDDFGLTVVINRAMSARQFLIQLAEHFDGYVSVNKDGQLRLKIVRNRGSITTIDESDMVAEPRIESGDWAEVRTHTRVVFSNGERFWKEDAITWRDPAAFEIVGENSPITLQRPWITRQDIARQVAGATGASLALPGMEIRLRVIRSAIEFNAIGQRLSVSYSDIGLSAFVVRVTDQSIQSPSSQVVDITAKVDRGYLNDPFYGTADDTYSDGDDITVDGALNVLVLELPLAMSLPPTVNKIGTFQASRGRFVVSGVPVSLAVFVVRGDEFTNGYNIHLKKGSEDSYVQISRDEAIAIHGTLDADYTAQTHKIDSAVGMLVDLDSIDNEVESPGIAEALENRFLVFVNGEIMSLLSATLVSGDTYRIYVIRNRFDTQRVAHTTGDEVWIVPRELISPFTQSTFRQGGEISMKVQPSIDDQAYDLSLITPETITPIARARRPTPPANLRRCPDATKLYGDQKTPTYANSGGAATIHLRWDTTDPADDDFFVRWKAVTPPSWSSGETYAIGDEVLSGSRVYVSIVDSNTAIEPNVTTNWQLYWMLRDFAPPATELEFRTSGGTLVRTVTVGGSYYKVTYTTLTSASWFNTTPLDSFVLRAYATKNGQRSTNYTEITLNRV